MSLGLAEVQAAPIYGAAVMPAHVNGELIVKLRDQGVGRKRASSLLFASLNKALGGATVLSAAPFETDSSLYVVKISDDSKLQAAMMALSSEPAIQYSEPNYLYTTQDQDGSQPEDPVSNLPNDADFSKLWGLNNVGQADSAGQVGTAGSDIEVAPLWQAGITGDKRVVVAVIDTGIDHLHPDLADNIFTNAGEIAGNNIDDDKNGFIDDVHGYNFEARNANARDDHDHGSHCAGTIGGVGNNGVGVTGVAWNVTLMPLKFLSASGSGSLQGAVESINYARMMKVNVMSNSWGGGGFSQTLKDAIEATKEAGIVFVAAAGNDSSNNDASPAYPASYDISNIISVAATDNRDNIARFSNYGSAKVHVAAPGVKIHSTTKNGGYNSFSGTSMATPHVSGIVALMLSAHPEWNYEEIKNRLIQTSEPVRALRRKVMAKGRVNAFNAMNGIIPPSNEPDESLWQTVDYLVESEHPYTNKADQSWTINYPGAKNIRVIFEKVETEAKYDKVTVGDSAGRAIDELSGKVENYTTDYVEGDTVKIRFRSDESVAGWGFRISKIQVIPATE
jgi:subtilisin family serine protease